MNIENPIDKYFQILLNESKIGPFPRTFNITDRMNGELLALIDEQFNLISIKLKDHIISRNFYICGGENDSTIDEFITINKK